MSRKILEITRKLKKKKWENIHHALYLRISLLISEEEGEPQYSEDTREPLNNWTKAVKLDITCKAYKQCSKRLDYF